ncbi:Uncharacterised protein [Vibrio cholerae]|nr:Uncharacterised protein [Vibrio cholerae]CSI96540.1 Uncharacterised protein [Vibrio cholerae]
MGIVGLEELQQFLQYGLITSTYCQFIAFELSEHLLNDGLRIVLLSEFLGFFTR